MADNRTLSYTIKVDGIEDLLTKLGQLEKQVHSLDLEFENVSKESKETKTSLDELAKSAQQASNATSDNGISAKKLKEEQERLYASLSRLYSALDQNTKSNKELKDSQEKLAENTDKLDTSMQKGSKSTDNLKKSTDMLAVQMMVTGKAMDEPVKASAKMESSFTQNMEGVKDAISGAAEGIEAMKKVAGNLNIDGLEQYSSGFDRVADAVDTSQQAMTLLNGVMSAGGSIISTVQGILALYREGVAISTIASAAFNAVLGANPIGAVAAAIAALIAVGVGLVSFFSGNSKAAEELNTSLDKQNAAFDAHKDAVNKDIELMKAKGASDEEIADAQQNLIQEELDLRKKQLTESQKMLQEGSSSQKEEIRKKIEDIKGAEESLSKDLQLIQQERINKQKDLDMDAAGKLKELQTANIRDRVQREKQELDDRQKAEMADFKTRYANAKDYDALLAELEKRQAQQKQDLNTKIADENTQVKRLTDSISQLSSRAMNELILKGDVSERTMDKLVKKTLELQEAERKFKEQADSTPEAIDAKRVALEREMEAEQLIAQRKLELNKDSLDNDKVKAAEEEKIKLDSLQKQKSLLESFYTTTAPFNEKQKAQYAEVAKAIADMNEKLKQTSELQTDLTAKNTQGVPLSDLDKQTAALKVFLGLYFGFQEKSKEGIGKTSGDSAEEATNSLGLGPEAQKKVQKGAQQVQQIVSQSSQAIGSIFEAQKQAKLNDIQEQEDREIAAVENSSATEAEKATRIDAIKKDAADKAHKADVEEKKKKQKLDIITGIINTALAITQALASNPPPVSYVMAALAAATGAAQVAVVATQQFAQGGIIPFEEGGMVQGPSHAQGGVPFVAGGVPMEAEGGELIVNRNIWRRPDFVRSISAMNAITGGKRFFAHGGIIPAPSVPGVQVPTLTQQNPIDTKAFIKGLRGVIASEVGSLKVTNNVVDTTSQQTRILNQQLNSKF